MLDDGMHNVTSAPTAEIDAKLERLIRRAKPVRDKLAELEDLAAPLRKRLDELEMNIEILESVRKRRPQAARGGATTVRPHSAGSANGQRRSPSHPADADRRSGHAEAPNGAPRPSRTITLGAAHDPTGRKQRLLDRFGREPVGFEFTITDALGVVREFEPHVKRRAIEATLKRMATENEVLIKVAPGHYRLAPQAFGQTLHAIPEVPPAHPIQ